MTNHYSLTVMNRSELTQPTFAVFAKLPVTSQHDVLPLAWLTQKINRDNEYVFEWDITWGFSWSATGTREGYQWTGSGKQPANPNSASGCAVDFGYNGDFYFATSERSPTGDQLWIDDLPTIPLPSKQPSSVGVTLNGSTACVMDAGPNLFQSFKLHPTYYISGGNYLKGQMVSGNSVTKYQVLDYKGTNRALTATLKSDNTWQVQPSSQINFAELLSSEGYG